MRTVLSRHAPVVVPAVMSLAGLAFYLWCFYPGSMSPDSAYAWWLARGGASDNVQGIGLTWLWRLTDWLLPGPAGPFVFIHLLFWIGLTQIALVLPVRPLARALFILVAGFAPVCCVLLSHVWSDVALMAALTSATAALLRFRDQRRTRWLIVAVLLLWWSLILRHNALFAVAPLYVYTVYLWNSLQRDSPLPRPWRIAGPLTVAAALWFSIGETTAPEPLKTMYVTPLSVPPLLGSGLMPSALAVAYDASPMIWVGPVSPTTAYSTWLL